MQNNPEAMLWNMGNYLQQREKSLKKDFDSSVEITEIYRCIFLSIRLLKYISSTVFPQNLNLPLFYKHWASMFTWAEKWEIQILRNTVEDMYFKCRILKKIHLYVLSIKRSEKKISWN